MASSTSLPLVSVTLSFKGQNVTLENLSTSTTGTDLYEQTRKVFSIPETTELKLLFKGKKVGLEDHIFTSVPTQTKKKTPPKIMVMATSSSTISHIASQRSDPLIRGFDKEQQKQTSTKNAAITGGYWGRHTQDKNYKFCKIQACDWQSFGHRPNEKTPHEFQAQRLLERLANDPGIVAIMKERELVVNTLGEMDPIDDRLMQKTEASGGCLLGYNTNRGLRIDIKLRTDDLQAFRPYPSLVATLIHELSHNWVGEHDLVFWTNFGQMRAEYLYWHLHHTREFVHGKTTAELAELPTSSKHKIFEFIMQELLRDMHQHGLHPNSIQAPIRQRCDELDATYNRGRRLGGDDKNLSAREKALEAAERRRRQGQQPENKE